MHDLETLVRRCFCICFGGLLFAAYPIALLPPDGLLDRPWIRLPATAAIPLAAGCRARRQNRWRNRLGWAGAGLLAGLGLLFMPAGLSGAAQFFWLPAAAILTGLGLALLAATRWHLPQWLFGTAALYLLAAVVAALRPGTELQEAAASSGMVAIPLAVAVWWRQRQPSPVAVAGLLAALWAVMVVYGIYQFAHDRDATGLALNRNWSACTVVALAPWVIYWLWQRWGAGRTWRARLLLAALPAAATIAIFWQNQSRGAALALAAYGAIVFLWWLPNWRRRFAALAAGLALLLVAGAVFRGPLARMQERDVRLPLWHGCLRLIAAHPWLGVGPGNYDKQQVQYLPGTDYHEKLDFASHIEHPHNELLNVAAGLGIPAALAWLVLLATVLRSPRGQPGWWRLAQFSAIVIIAHAMLDKTLVQTPCNLLALGAIGILWHRSVRLPGGSLPARFAWFFRLRAAAALVLLAWSAWIGLRECRYGWHFRLGQIDLASGNSRQALARFERCRRLAPNGREEPHFAAGVAALRLPDRLQDAFDALVSVYEINPAYDHVNRLLARCYLLADRPRDALPYLQRETVLFPGDAAVAQHLYVGLYLAGRSTDLPRAADRCRTLYRRHARLALGEDLAGWQSDWRRAMAAGDPGRSVAIANHRAIVPKLTEFLDPSLPALTAAAPWPDRLVFSREFLPIDYEYWRRVDWRRRTLDLLRNPEIVPLVQAGRLTQALHERLAMAPRGVPFRLPDRAWAESAADPLEACATLAWLFDGLGLPAAIGLDARGQPVGVAVVVDGACQMANPADGTVRPLAPGLVDRFRLYDDPVAFLLRNHILGELMRAPAAHPGGAFDAIPSERSVRIREALQAAGVDAGDPIPHLDEPFAAFRDLSPPPASSSP